MKRLSSEKGFTLIELLIVIVIIGILAGVLIAIIDPVSQQNKARDAGVKAALDKVALATQGYISAYGQAPNDLQFFGGLSNVNDIGASCASGTDGICIFDVTGNPLHPAGTDNGCNAATTWTGLVTETGKCYYHYTTVPAISASAFQLHARSYGMRGTVFQYANYSDAANGIVGGTIQHCNGTAAGVSGCVTP